MVHVTWHKNAALWMTLLYLVSHIVSWWVVMFVNADRASITVMHLQWNVTGKKHTNWDTEICTYTWTMCLVYKYSWNDFIADNLQWHIGGGDDIKNCNFYWILCFWGTPPKKWLTCWGVIHIPYIMRSSVHFFGKKMLGVDFQVLKLFRCSCGWS